jgi:hypothetical protein
VEGVVRSQNKKTREVYKVRIIKKSTEAVLAEESINI